MIQLQQHRQLAYRLLAGAMAVLFAIQGGLVFWRISQGKDVDYGRWHKVARMALEGKALANLDANIPQDSDALNRPGADEGLKFYKLPPAYAVLISPLGLLPYPVYVVFWYVASVASVAAAVLLLMRMVHGRWLPDNPWACILPVLAVVPFVMDDTHCGTCNLHILFLLVLGAYLAGRGMNWGGGLAVGLAISCKAFPVAMLPVLVVTRRWRLLAWTLVGVLLWTLVVPGAFRGYQRQATETAAWYHRIIGPYVESQPQRQWRQQGLSIKNQSLYSLVHRLTEPVDARSGELCVAGVSPASGSRPAVRPPAQRPAKNALFVNVVSLSGKTADRIFAGLVALIGLVIAAACWWRPLKPTPAVLAAELGVWGCFILMVSTIGWVYFFALMLPAMAVVAARACQPPARPWRLLLMTAIALTILDAIPLAAALGALAISSILYLAAMLILRRELAKGA